MRVAELRFLLEIGLPVGAHADTDVLFHVYGTGPDGSPHVKCHPVGMHCTATAANVRRSTVRHLLEDDALFPEGAGSIVFCQSCVDVDDFGALARSFDVSPLVASVLYTTRDHVRSLHGTDEVNRNDSLRQLRRPVPERAAWSRGPDDPVWLWYLQQLTDARDEAEGYAAQVRSRWTGPLALVAVRHRKKRAWAQTHRNDDLDAALAAAETVGHLDIGSAVLAVPADLAHRVRRNQTWAHLGPAVTGPQLQARLAMVNAATTFELPHQGELDDLIAAAAAVFA